MIGIERGGQKVRIAKLKVSGCFLRTHCTFCIQRASFYLFQVGIERLEKTDLACILVLVDCLPNHSLLELAESDLQPVQGSMDWWALCWWCDQVHNPRGKIFISGYVLFLRGDRYFSDLSSFEIVKSILELGISNTLTFISWKKWWSHGNKVPVLKHECLHQMLRLTDTYGSWYR